MAKVSFSAYQVWEQCPRQFKLSQIDKLASGISTIHLIFGSAMHEVIQSYLDVCLHVSKAQADRSMDLPQMLVDSMKKHYLKQRDSAEVLECTKEELIEFANDGITILNWLQKRKNFNKFFDLKYEELKHIEYNINTPIRDNIHYIGFIDLVMYNKYSKRYKIIDLKTSTKGWGKFKKQNFTLNSQVLLYKKFYSELLNIPIDKIDVEFIILKRKINEDSEFPIPRISRHVPASGKPSMNKAWSNFENFINSVYNEDGSFKTDEKLYPKRPSKLCDWCEFYHRKICDGK